MSAEGTLKMLGVAVTAMALALSPALVEAVPLSPPLPFTVSEGAVPLSAPLVLLVDRFSQTFSTAGVQAVGGVDLSGADDPFTQVGNATASIYLLGVVPVPSQLNAPAIFAPLGYKLYATFAASGEAEPIVGPPAGILGIYSAFALSLFLDPLQDTSLPAGAGAPAAGGADDILIATATLAPAGLCAPDPSCGISHTFPGLAAGDFALILDFLLVPPTGPAYFSAPVPFHNLLALTGVVSTVTGGFGGPFSTAGSGDAFFTRQIPAPASLVLLGLGVLGAAAGLRRWPRR